VTAVSGSGYQSPRTLAEVEATLAAGASAGAPPVVMAGGTDLVARARALLRDRPILEVARVAELGRVTVTGDELVVGATVTWADCLTDPVIRRAAPLLTRVAERFASPAIRNLATLGGNVANASPAGDGLAALWALDAAVDALTPGGPVRMALGRLVLGPGRVDLPPGSVITAFRVPAAGRQEGAGFYKLVNRAWPEHPMAIAVASVAVRLRLDVAGRVALVRIVLGAVGPTPRRAAESEMALLGSPPDAARLEAAAAAAAAAATPIDDLRATAAYRREVLPALARAALEAAVAAARGEVGRG
jgi:CO/xanthine dehydrogenase FAD-binding subunit